MKQFGRKHRPYYRICAMDIRKPRDGRVLEELGTYDPLVPETDARAVLNGERINYWVSVGAQPSDKVQVLIKKYGAGGTHVAEQQTALAGWPRADVGPSRCRRCPGPEAGQAAEEEGGREAGASAAASRRRQRPMRRRARGQDRTGCRA